MCLVLLIGYFDLLAKTEQREQESCCFLELKGKSFPGCFLDETESVHLSVITRYTTSVLVAAAVGFKLNPRPASRIITSWSVLYDLTLRRQPDLLTSSHSWPVFLFGTLFKPGVRRLSVSQCWSHSKPRKAALEAIHWTRYGLAIDLELSQRVCGSLTSRICSHD